MKREDERWRKRPSGKWWLVLHVPDDPSAGVDVCDLRTFAWRHFASEAEADAFMTAADAARRKRENRRQST